MKKENVAINLIPNAETLAAVHTHTHTHTCSFISNNAILASINNVKKGEKF